MNLFYKETTLKNKIIFQQTNRILVYLKTQGHRCHVNIYTAINIFDII
jgi:hypothetical protein